MSNKGRPSMLPVRRSKSVSRDNRESYLPKHMKRGSSIDRPARPTLGARSNSSNNLKIPQITTNSVHPAAGSARSSRSTIKETPRGYKTPDQFSLNRVSTSTSRFRSKSPYKDERPIQNKEWQKNEISKIVRLLAMLDPIFKFTKPLCLRDFVHIVQIFVHELGVTQPQVRFENYVTTVPIILKNFMYVGNMSASSLKMANTMHGWPHTIAILSFLADLLYLQNEDDSLDENTYIDPVIDGIYKSIYTNSLATLESFNKTGNYNNELHNPELKSKLYKLMNIDIVEVEKLKKEIKKYEQIYQDETEKYLKIEQKYDHLRTCEMEMDALLKDYYTNNEEYQRKMESKLAIIKSKLKENTDIKTQLELKRQQLENIVSTQQYNIEDVEQLQKELEEVDIKVDLMTERNDHFNELFNKHSLDMSKENAKLHRLAASINTQCSDLSLESPIFKSVKVPEIGFARVEIEELKQQILMYNDITNEIENKKHNMELRLEKLFDINGKNYDIYNTRVREKQDIERELKSLRATLQRERDEFDIQMVQENKNWDKEEALIEERMNELKVANTRELQSMALKTKFENKYKEMLNEKERRVQVREESFQRAYEIIHKFHINNMNIRKSFNHMVKVHESSIHQIKARLEDRNKEV